MFFYCIKLYIIKEMSYKIQVVKKFSFGKVFLKDEKYNTKGSSKQKVSRRQILRVKLNRFHLINQIKQNTFGESGYSKVCSGFYIEDAMIQFQYHMCLVCGSYSYQTHQGKVNPHIHCTDLEHVFLTEKEYIKHHAKILYGEYKKNYDIFKKMGIVHVKEIVSQGKEIIDILRRNEFYVARDFSVVNLFRENPIPAGQFHKFFHNGLIFHSYELNKRRDGISNEKKEERRRRYFHMAQVVNIDSTYLLDLQKLLFEYECVMIVKYPWMKQLIYQYL